MKKFRSRQTQSTISVSHTRPSEVEALLAASQAVNSALGLESALQVVLASALQLTSAHEGSVMLVGEDDHLVIFAGLGIPTEAVSSTRIPLGQGVAGKVAATGQALLLNVPPSERDFHSFVPETRPLISSVSVPLRAAGRVVGVLNLNLVEGERLFGDDDLRLAMLFGEQAAMAIHKAQLLDSAEGRGDQLTALLEAGRGLMGYLEIDLLLDRVLDGALRLTEGRAGFACLQTGDAQPTVPACHGLVHADVRQRVLHSGASFMKQDGVTVLEPDASSSLNLLAWEGERAVVISAPIESSSRLGVVCFTSSSHLEKLNLLQTFGTQAVLAVRNAQLYGQVEAAQNELASVVSSMTQPVLVADGDGKLVLANPAAEVLFGFVVDFAKGQPIDRIVDNEDLVRLLSQDDWSSLEITAGNPNPKQWKATVTRIRASSGGAERVLVLEDVTAEREAERLKSDFVAVLGHELRTPLTLIKGFVKTLIRAGDRLDEQTRHEALESIDAQSHRLERLIEDVLYVSRVETSRSPLLLENTDAAGVARSMATEFKAREPKRQFLITAPQTLPLLVDKTKLEQVLYHLIDNACKYSETNTTIEVHVTELEDSIRFEVADKGIGILSSEIPHLFERFHQVDGSSTRTAGGTGVGLFICKSLVEAHSGQIGVASAWGKGSTFYFTIPKNLKPQPQEISAPV